MFIGKELHEPVDRVPFPNSSNKIRERAVEFLRASETFIIVSALADAVEVRGRPIP